jgi:anti-anti-sigma factor
LTQARFVVSVASGDQPPEVAVSGEIDLANVEEFEAAMAAARGGSPALIVDFTELIYCDSAAVRALFGLAADAQLTMIVKPTGHITTLLAISGLDRVANVVRKD